MTMTVPPRGRVAAVLGRPPPGLGIAGDRVDEGRRPVGEVAWRGSARSLKVSLGSAAHPVLCV